MSITKESEAKKGNFTARCLLALGSLCTNAPSSAFFTCSDIVYRLIDGQECTKDEFSKLTNWCSTSLCQRYEREHTGLYRTNKKIQPQVCPRKESQISYGYRVGMPVETPVINKDTVVSARNACANPTSVGDIHVIIQNASVSQLTDLILEITDAIVNKHSHVVNDAAASRSKLQVLRTAIAEVDV